MPCFAIRNGPTAWAGKSLKNREARENKETIITQ